MNKIGKSKTFLFREIKYSDKESVLISIKFIYSNIFFLFFALNLLLLLNLISCNTTEPPIIPPPPPDLRKITLTFEDASCTEVWLRVKADSITLPVEIKLMQETTQQNITLTVKDSVIYIDSLNPNQTYVYQAVLNKDTTIKSEKITAQTLEPTSHNFTWQSWEFGQHSSSVLYDVAIIDENNIWAVDEIYMNDSLGNPDPTLYNIIKWDGVQWKVERVYYNYQGSNFIAPLFSIIALTATDIWVGSNQPMHLIYNKWEKWDLLSDIWNGWINKIWGTSKNDLYIVGNGGEIAHYNNTTWTKIESGTTLNIYDIWGDINPNTNEYEIIALASDHTSGKGTKLLRINGTNVENISTEGLPLSMDAIWFRSLRKYYAVGDGFYSTQILGNQWLKNNSIPKYHKTTISSTNLNNIFLGGAYGLFMHFNGVEWNNYQFNVVSYNDFFSSIDLKSNLVCAVGANMNNKAIIYLDVK